jgi:hypothetical protein
MVHYEKMKAAFRNDRSIRGSIEFATVGGQAGRRTLPAMIAGSTEATKQ